MTRKHDTAVRRKATPKRPRNEAQVEKTSELTGTAWRQCLREKRVSVREGARLIGVTKNTAQRYKAEGFETPPLRSKKLARCFVKNLNLLLELRDGKAA